MGSLRLNIPEEDVELFKYLLMTGIDHINMVGLYNTYTQETRDKIWKAEVIAHDLYLKERGNRECDWLD